MILLHSSGSPWDFDLHADVLVLCVAMLSAYAYAVTGLREEISDAGRVKRTQMALFGAGVLTIFVAAGTPIHDLAERYWLSAHMLQHLLFTLVAAPLLLAGTPSWLLRAPLRWRGVLPAARVATHPLVAFGLFNAVLVVTHLPVAMNASLEHHWLHFVVHAVLVASAVLMWWPILSTVPELPRLSEPLQMAYLFLQSLLPTVVASFITFSDRAVYTFYADAPRLAGVSPVADQQIGGGVMKVVGSLIIWSFIVVAFFRWYQRDQAAEQGPSWDEVEEELEELGLTAKR